MASTNATDIEFGKLLADRSGINLVRLMLEFSTDAYADVDWMTCLAEIDRLGQAAAERVSQLDPDATLRARLQEVSRLLYDDEGFRGNKDDYYDPSNSYLNEVLSRRAGIPITLGIVYMAVAQLAGLNVYGVSTPGHFVLACEQDGQTLYIDPFGRGDVLTKGACRRRIERINGQPDSITDEHFQPASVRDIAVRVLRNLKAAYAMQNRWTEALPVQKRLTLLLPDLPDERRDLGLIYLRTGHAQRAIQMLRDYVRECTEDDARLIAPYLRTALRLQAEMN